MSLTYISSIIQFLIVLELVTPSEGEILSNGATAILALITLGFTLWGRYRLGDISIFGTRK